MGQATLGCCIPPLRSRISAFQKAGIRTTDGTPPYTCYAAIVLRHYEVKEQMEPLDERKYTLRFFPLIFLASNNTTYCIHRISCKFHLSEALPIDVCVSDDAGQKACTLFRGDGISRRNSTRVFLCSLHLCRRPQSVPDQTTPFILAKLVAVTAGQLSP